LQRDNRTAGTDGLQGAPFEGSLEKGGYAPPTDWKSILDAERAREKTEAKEPVSSMFIQDLKFLNSDSQTESNWGNYEKQLAEMEAN
jgi:hypothetical protein